MNELAQLKRKEIALPNIGNDFDNKKLNAIANKLKISTEHAKVYYPHLAKIPNERLNDFFAWRLNFERQHARAELVTMEAVRAFRRGLFFEYVARGFKFKNATELKREISDIFRGEVLTHGVSGEKSNGYLPFVSFSIDELGNIINNYTDKKLNSADSAELWQWLFLHQEFIGDDDVMSYQEFERQERAKEQERIKAEYDALSAKQAQRNANKARLNAKFSALCIKVG